MPFDVQPYIDAAAKMGLRVITVTHGGIPASRAFPFISILFKIEGCDENFGITSTGWDEEGYGKPLAPERWAEITSVEVHRYRELRKRD